MNETVKLQYPEPTIAVIVLEDRAFRNTFSTPLIQGLTAAFASLKPETKVVVIHGYENYFCCGGTQEELLKLSEGKMTFADLDFYRLLLDCEVPTIAAMQGHALGGGLVFGCYADIILMAEECLYSANFMKYGFTPGMGATYILAKKLGEVLAQEMLLTAKNYHGGELRERGAQINVVKKSAVLTAALALAKELTEKPLISLKLLKQQHVRAIKAELPAVIEQELAMHAITFKLPEVKEKIQQLFGE